MLSRYKLVSWSVLQAQSTTRDYIRADGDFHKEINVERTNTVGIRPEEQSEKAKSCRENLRNERQLKGPKRRGETTQEQSKKEWVSSTGLCQRHNLVS